MPHPAGYSYSAIVIDGFPFRPITPDNAVIDWNANVGIVPEPTTVALVGTELLGMLAEAYRKRSAA